MKYCNKCKTDADDSLSFCTNCGSQLVEKKAEKPQNTAGKIIKRIILAIVAAGLVFFAWYSHWMNATTYLALNSRGEVFAKSGGSTAISIDYDGNAWEVTYQPTWVEVLESSDNSFTIYCNQNTTGSDREDHITVKSGKIIQTLPIGQFGKAQYLTLSESAISSDTDGGSIYIDINTDGCDVKMEYPKFCEIDDFTTDGFLLKVKPNEGNTRSGTIKVTEDNLTGTLYVHQEGECPDCNGNGRKTCYSCSGMGYSGWGMYSMTCYTCGGAGTIGCHSCGGDGYR